MNGIRAQRGRSLTNASLISASATSGRPMAVSQSLEMHRVMRMIERVAPSSASIILTGETGTGKEIAARSIHELSPRRHGPYIAINCAAMPETLMESELFGHERGAFTGADRRREGCFELANGGTLLLDEIGEMKPGLQAKLLRVLEERKLRRLGSSAEVAIDVRVLAATNCDLETAIKDLRFREDLYYRLNVFTIELPPLWRRPDDIEGLVHHFLRELEFATDTVVTGIDAQCLEVLKSHRWPGNVRELRNVIERALIVTHGPLLGVADLSSEIRRSGTVHNCSVQPYPVRVGMSLDEAKREFIIRTLDFVGGNKTRAAKLLGITARTLYRRLA
jgi:two-component system, NtrC family, response regulator HydG